MNQMINDWISFCEKGTVYEDGYFYTLFMENITPEEIREVYKYFPNSERLVKKMERFLFEEKTKNVDLENTKNELERLIRLDFDERTPILQKLEIFSKFNTNPNFIFTSDLGSISSMILDDIWSQAFYDYVNFQTIEDDAKTYALYDALYGITYDFDFRLFLFEPLLNVKYSVESLYKFKRLGGVYAITEEGVYYSFKDNT